jgi:hypothetical protein
LPQQEFDETGLDPRWRALTADPLKFDLFQKEEHLALGVAAAERALGPDFAGRMQRLALLVVQPDAIAERKVELCLRFLHVHAFEPVVAVPFVLEAEMTAEVWRYQVNTATQDSRDVCDLFCAKTESLLLILADQTSRPSIPASLRMTELKGASAPGLRTSSHLRTVLGGTNRIVSAAHCSDEPIDMLREPAILFPTGVDAFFGRIADVLDGRREPRVEEEIKALYARTPRHDIDVGRAVERIIAQLPASALAPGGLPEKLRAWQRRERFLDWQEFSADLRDAGLDPHGWDALLVASEYLNYDRVGVSRILNGSGYEQWAAGEGELLIG